MSAVASVTLHRVAITLPQWERSEGRSHDEWFSICAEIGERLDELDALKAQSSGDLVVQLGKLASTSRAAYHIAIQLMHGASDTTLSSYCEQAEKRGRTKQDVHWEFANELRRIEQVFPALHRHILATRRQAQQHEDPISQAEVVGRAGGANDAR